MELHQLKPTAGSRSKKRYRVGRGMAQGRGKQAGKGQSGQNKRKGHRPGFEGGQNPWFRRLPKRGFLPPNQISYQIIALSKLEQKFTAGTTVDRQALLAKKIIKSKTKPIKLLATGKITKQLVVKVEAASKGAIAAIKQAKGSVELI